jgi:hypothetical protein
MTSLNRSIDPHFFDQFTREFFQIEPAALTLARRAEATDFYRHTLGATGGSDSPSTMACPALRA